MVFYPFGIGICGAFRNAECDEELKDDFMSNSRRLGERLSQLSQFDRLIGAGRHETAGDQARDCPVGRHVRDTETFRKSGDSAGTLLGMQLRDGLDIVFRDFARVVLASLAEDIGFLVERLILCSHGYIICSHGYKSMPAMKKKPAAVWTPAAGKVSIPGGWRQEREDLKVVWSRDHPIAVLGLGMFELGWVSFLSLERPRCFQLLIVVTVTPRASAAWV